MNLPTPNEIRKIRNEDLWFSAMNEIRKNKELFTEQQTEVLLDAFKESGMMMWPWDTSDANYIVNVYFHVGV